MDKLIQQHETGRCPKTAGQRIEDFMEKLLNPDTYHAIVQSIYRAFREKPKSPPVRIDDCG
jgi:hypothetical protein